MSCLLCYQFIATAMITAPVGPIPESRWSPSHLHHDAHALKRRSDSRNRAYVST